MPKEPASISRSQSKIGSAYAIKNTTQDRFHLFLKTLPAKSRDLNDYKEGKKWLSDNFYGTCQEYERLTMLLAKHLGV